MSQGIFTKITHKLLGADRSTEAPLVEQDETNLLSAEQIEVITAALTHAGIHEDLVKEFTDLANDKTFYNNGELEWTERGVNLRIIARLTPTRDRVRAVNFISNNENSNWGFNGSNADECNEQVAQVFN